MNIKHRKHKYKIGDMVWVLGFGKTNSYQLSFSHAMIVGTETVMKNEIDWPTAQAKTNAPASLAINTTTTDLMYCTKTVAVNYYKVLQDNIQTHLVKEDVVAKRLSTLKKRLSNSVDHLAWSTTTQQIFTTTVGTGPAPSTVGGYVGGYPREWLTTTAPHTFTYKPQFVYSPYVPMDTISTCTLGEETLGEYHNSALKKTMLTNE